MTPSPEGVTLFFSDMHFGRGSRAEGRASEAALVACLRHYEAVATRLYLVGDVFDEYIEYRTLVPKGFVRFQALLAEWTDRGVPVSYLAGNHDPWHIDYFEQEIGVRMVFEPITEHIGGWTIHLAHGDGIARNNRVYRRLKPLLRHPLPVWLYRALLPADAGLRLARWVNRRFGRTEIDEDAGSSLRAHARHVLSTTDADLVVMGHSHQPDRWQGPEGTYLNLGSWHDDRTYACLDARGPRLLRWNGAQPQIVDLKTRDAASGDPSPTGL